MKSGDRSASCKEICYYSHTNISVSLSLVIKKAILGTRNFTISKNKSLSHFVHHSLYVEDTFKTSIDTRLDTIVFVQTMFAQNHNVSHETLTDSWKTGIPIAVRVKSDTRIREHPKNVFLFWAEVAFWFWRADLLKIQGWHRYLHTCMNTRVPRSLQLQTYNFKNSS